MPRLDHKKADSRLTNSCRRSLDLSPDRTSPASYLSGPIWTIDISLAWTANVRCFAMQIVAAWPYRLDPSLLSDTQTIRKLELSLLRYYVITAVKTARRDKLLEFFDVMGPDLSHEPSWGVWWVFIICHTDGNN